MIAFFEVVIAFILFLAWKYSLEANMNLKISLVESSVILTSCMIIVFVNILKKIKIVYFLLPF